jgi:hypothetical protein
MAASKKKNRPALKEVGKRRPPKGGAEMVKCLTVFNQTVNTIGPPKIPKAKGVFRFKTHEEADAWTREMMLRD